MEKFVVYRTITRGEIRGSVDIAHPVGPQEGEVGGVTLFVKGKEWSMELLF